MEFIYILITITIILCIIYNFNGNNKINIEFALKVKFKNMIDIKKSYWYSYLKLIYSDEQIKAKLPFSMDDFWIIYRKLLPNNIVLNNISNSPSKNKSLFTDLDSHVSSLKSVIYIYQYNKMPGDIDFCPNCLSDNLNKKKWGNSIPDLNFKLLKGFKNDTWVEIHKGPDKLNGYTWLYYMPGSGNWINLGKSASGCKVGSEGYSKPSFITLVFLILPTLLDLTNTLTSFTVVVPTLTKVGNFL